MRSDTPPPSPSPTDPFALGLTINLPFLDELYERWSADPESVDASWRPYFEGRGVAGKNGQAAVAAAPAGTNGNGNGHGNGHVAARGTALAAPSPSIEGAAQAVPVVERGGGLRLDEVFALVNAYRTLGHRAASLDPLGLVVGEQRPELDPASYGFTDADLDQRVPFTSLYGVNQPTLRDVVARLRATYCRHIGVELMHISDLERRTWLAQRMEASQNEPEVDAATKLYILDRLAGAELFESFVHKRFVGAKRFSLEGGDALIPLLDLALERAGVHGTEEAVIGMAHRGRLNVLANILGKSPGTIFAEFEDIDPRSVLGGGDVKYHLGYSSEHTTRAGQRLHLSLAFNPSHLEAVDPVVLGRVRAKQRRRRDSEKRKVLGILIHGDAAFAGQGLVYESLNLSDLRGYRTGGTLHVVVNNQIGFTTNPSDGRSTPYCTDVAKCLQVPIFHVNGDDPEAVVHVVRLAMDYRREFQSDVVLDMYCFRRYGHNEGDEPGFTQPLLYDAIRRHPTQREIYAQRLIGEGVTTAEAVKTMLDDRTAALESEFARAKATLVRPTPDALGGVWKGYEGGLDTSVADVDTGVGRDRLDAIGERVTTVPAEFHPHPKVQKLLGERAEMVRGQRRVDWGMGETLAYGSLLWDGRVIRMTGQDCRRGTFSHRHAVLFDTQNGGEYSPLKNLTDSQGVFSIFDSPLSEMGVLGFEYGYSLDFPDGLVIWEAQFGDFVNGAQVILDQFISSSEDKWRRLSGLTLFLPHGYEGQGPEHSSARFERFLQLCAEDNMQVCQPTTPAQVFHMLRRQVLRPWRKPLIVMTPKSLLRLPAASSSIEEFTTGRFQRVLDDPQTPIVAKVKRILLCTGKVYYELADERKKRADETVAILRLEQLYPLSDFELRAVMDRYFNAAEIFWVQDEPANMGARTFIEPILRRLVGRRVLRAVSRVESASPATGSMRAHQIEQIALLDQAFGPLDA